MDIQQAINELNAARKATATYKAAVDDAKARLESSELWKAFADSKESLERAQVATEYEAKYVRELALTAYGETGDKQVHPAVQVKIYAILDYDPANALDYAREHLPGALKLNKQAFEKAAKAIGLDFVTMDQEPRAVIAGDLSKYVSD